MQSSLSDNPLEVFEDSPTPRYWCCCDCHVIQERPNIRPANDHLEERILQIHFCWLDQHVHSLWEHGDWTTYDLFLKPMLCWCCWSRCDCQTETFWLVQKEIPNPTRNMVPVKRCFHQCGINPYALSMSCHSTARSPLPSRVSLISRVTTLGYLMHPFATPAFCTEFPLYSTCLSISYNDIISYKNDFFFFFFLKSSHIDPSQCKDEIRCMVMITSGLLV